MQDADKVIAVLCADIHLSLNPPRARREELDWFKAMKKPLDEIALVAKHYDVPILCAGDVFDHWKAEPALLNFALRYFPQMWAIPGQHDLPFHNIDLIEKSAFWTMCLAERIRPVLYEAPIAVENSDIILHAFPWGRKLKPIDPAKTKRKFHIALVHDYFWMDGFAYPGASIKTKASQFRDLVKGYHAVIFGDNHKGFKTKLNNVTCWNCGTFMRRKSDEKEYAPQIGLLCASGNILTHRLSTRGEILQTVEEDLEGRWSRTSHEMDDFINGLRDVMRHSFDFIEAIEILISQKSINNDAKKILLEVLDRG